MIVNVVRNSKEMPHMQYRIGGTPPPNRGMGPKGILFTRFSRAAGMGENRRSEPSKMYENIRIKALDDTFKIVVDC